MANNLRAASASHPKPPSSGTSGFFQPTPKVENSFFEDEAFRRIFECHLTPALQSGLKPDLASFGSRVLDPQVLAHVADAEHNVPYLKTWNSFGHRQDLLVTSEGWRKLSAIGIQEGIVAIPYEYQYGPYSRVYQFLKYHLWTGSSVIVTCPSAMTDGAAKLLLHHLTKKNSTLSETERRRFQTAYDRLTSRDAQSAWTSGQWMTERPGGSDVRNTETQATFTPAFAPDESQVDTDGQPLGPWTVNGFKWFSSATDSQMTVLLAKMSDGNLSAFFAPMRRQRKQRNASVPSSPDTELNGIEIQRLKSKLGTRALPTAELSISGMRAYLLGSPGTGVKEISTVLNITRVHNVVSSVGLWGRGLAISRAFSRVRSTGGKLLIDHPAHVRTLAHQHVEYRAMMHLAFFVVTLLGISESATRAVESQKKSSSHDPPPGHLGLDAAAAGAGASSVPAHLLRLITPLAKAVTARAAIAGLAECMESLGGVGYLENDDPELNVARLYRDANVLSIWEGTTNIMADDVVRVLKGRDGTQVVSSLNQWARTVLTRNLARGQQFQDFSATLDKVSDRLATHILETPADGLRLDGRVLLSRLGWLICAMLLYADAARDGDAVAAEVLRRWMERRDRALYGFDFMDDGKEQVPLRGGDGTTGSAPSSVRQAMDFDRKIVFGASSGPNTERARM